MKKLLSVTACILLLNTFYFQSALAFNFSSLNQKRVKDTLAIMGGMLSIPCFKMSYDLCQESTWLLKSILPNYNGLMVSFDAECNKHLSHGFPSGAHARLWNKFLKTNVEPLCPELLPRLESLNSKAAALCLTGTLLITVALCRLLDNCVPKKSNPSETN